MDEWKQYRKLAVTEMRPYSEGEDLIAQGVSVWDGDAPELGGMVARDPKNREDSWYVSKSYFNENYNTEAVA